LRPRHDIKGVTGKFTNIPESSFYVGANRPFAIIGSRMLDGGLFGEKSEVLAKVITVAFWEAYRLKP
jgi:hypothetical protein